MVSTADVMSSAYVWSRGGLPFAGGEVVDIGTM